MATKKKQPPKCIVCKEIIPTLVYPTGPWGPYHPKCSGEITPVRYIPSWWPLQPLPYQPYQPWYEISSGSITCDNDLTYTNTNV